MGPLSAQNPVLWKAACCVTCCIGLRVPCTECNHRIRTCLTHRRVANRESAQRVRHKRQVQLEELQAKVPDATDLRQTCCGVLSCI